MDRGNSSYIPSQTSTGLKILYILLGALLVGFGWHIRGSGTSDPTIVILMLVLFMGIIFSPRNKNNFLVFGLIVLIFRVMRRGWGTFVGQVTGHLAGNDVIIGTETSINYDVLVPAWQGYFWLFIVGLAWAGLAALILGGYYFTSKKYSYKHLTIMVIIYVISFFLFLLIATFLIPLIAPDAYYNVYVNLQLERNYISMRDNLAFALAIIPVLIYIILAKKDYYFVKITVFIMLIFGFAFALADIWQYIGRTNLDLGLPFWSLWEYFSGFIVGALLMLMFFKISDSRWQESDNDIGFYPVDTPLKKIIYFGIAHVGLFLYGIQVSLIGLINSSANALNIELDLSSVYGIIFILLIDIPLYYLYTQGKYGKKFKEKDFQEKCIIILTLIIPYAYLCYASQFILAGTLFNLEIGFFATWLDTISMIIVEFFLIVLIIKRRGKRSSKSPV